jgi:DNA relaxase NicK
MVDITQTALDGLGWTRSLDLSQALLTAGLRASRLDLYLDDRKRRASARVVRGAIVQGDYVSHAQPGGYREDDTTGAATAYLGSRESERFLRAYDKDPNGEDPRTRWELENKGATARIALDLIASAHRTPDAARALVPGLLRAFVDFCDRDPGARGDRAPMLDWWQALMGDFAKVRGAVAVKVDSLARRVTWLRRQVAPTLAAVWARPEYGNGWLNDVLSDGLDRAGGLAWAGT